VKIPVICDADTGFGGPANAARTVQLFERAGLAGMHIEDQEWPKRCGHLAGKSLIAAEDMIEKIRAAACAKTDSDFLLIARTDARSVEGFNAAVERAAKYLEAGADAIFPEALESLQEFTLFARALEGSGFRVQESGVRSQRSGVTPVAVRPDSSSESSSSLNPQPSTMNTPLLLANMTEFGKGNLIPVNELAAAGYRMVIFPQTALRVMMKQAEACLNDLKRDGTQGPWLDRMQTRKELYELLKYDPNVENWVG
jgi:methylisocitrate lyase